MWDEEKDFEILDKVEEHDLHDENSDDYLYPELDLADNEDGNENSDVFDYEAGFYYDEEDE
ncbi:MAG: hypothetical protein GY845_24305 [Planctomycetes bacterium]|nr:hypothetical protein [Planctomycetota bacterium]